MSRGISENDVWTACDALLLAGERPTIERVRQKIGRGSPNTVSPMLDTWFKGLGGRIQDPGAFAAPSSIPDPVEQAAKHFWEVAQALARSEFDARLQISLQETEAAQRDAANAISQAIGAQEAAQASADELRKQVETLKARFDAERLAHAGTAARLEEAHGQNAAFQAALEKSADALREERARARAEIDTAHERASGAERRAAMEIDAARQQRIQADKRADGLERRLQSSVEQLQGELAAQMRASVQAASDLKQAQKDRHSMEDALASARAEGVKLSELLKAAELAVERNVGGFEAVSSIAAKLDDLARSAKRPTRALRRLPAEKSSDG